MTREQAINYLISSGFSKEQINEIVKAFEPTTNLVDFDRINKLADFGIRITGQKSDYLIGVCNGIEGLRATLTHTTPNLLETPTKNDSADLISREDALMCLTGEFEDRQYEPFELVSIFSKRIKHLPSVTPQEPRWIPVSERLPEEYKRVLVSDSWRGVYVGQYVDAEENWGGEHFINEAGMHSKTVVAWMPLPKPYEPQESEN